MGRRRDICADARALDRRARALDRDREALDARRRKAEERCAQKRAALESKQARARERVLDRQRKEAARAADVCGRYRRVAKRPAAARRPAAVAAETAGKVLRRRWPDVETPAGAFAVRLRLVPVEDVIASHDPTSWAVDPRYPRSTQERRYDRDGVEQLKVTKIARTLKPSLLLAATPSALDGPPIVAPDAEGQLIALGGNGRTMALRLAFAAKGKQAKAYRAALTKLLRRKVAPGMILVRELVPPPPAADWARWSRDLNRPLGAGLGLTAQAVSLSRSLPSRVPTLLAGRDLASALRTAVGREVLRELQLAGLVGAGERGLFEAEGLSEQGRALVRRALAGAAIGSADLIDALPPSVVDQIARSAASLLEAKAVGGKRFDALPALRAAAVDYPDATKWRGGIDRWLVAPHLLQPGTLRQPLGAAVIRSLVAGGLPAFADAWLSSARAQPEGQATMFADPRSPAEIAGGIVRGAR